jgi:hypothetical protein
MAKAQRGLSERTIAMGGNRQRSPFAQGLRVALAVLLAFASGPSTAISAEPPIAPMGSLSVASDPVGASIYIDGQFAGKSPVNLKQMTPGDHRVRIVQDGYLENGRVVNIREGRPSVLQVKLTRSTSSEAAAVAAPGQVGRPTPVQSTGGGGSKKWLWIGLAGGGAAAAAVYVLTKNGPPVAGTIGVTPTGTGMAGITNFSFTSQGSSDPNGDSLDYTWNFGDGGTGTGQTTSHTFGSPGTRTIELSITDGKETVSAPPITVVVAQSLAGTWTGGRDPGFNCGVNLAFTQSSGALAGSMIFTGTCAGTIPLSAGTASPLTHPSSVTWTTVPYNFNDGTQNFVGLTTRFTGATNGNGGSMTGTITTTQGANVVSATTTFTK